VLEAAASAGYDFSRISNTNEAPASNGTLYFVIYRKNGAVVPNSPVYTHTEHGVLVQDVPFFSQLSEGIDLGCRHCHYYLNISYIYENDDIEALLSEWKRLGAKGILLLGTEMEKHDIKPFTRCGLPVVLIDNYFEALNLDCVTINNLQGAYLATDYLIKQTHAQPGYLHSAYSITGFEERADGFYKAIRKNGMSTSRSVVHHLSPSVDGAYCDMKAVIKSGDELVRCYFADNDLIAAGAMRALSEAGYRIPEDISVIGFDDMPMCTYITPPLSTVHVPKQYMGEIAVKRLAEIINSTSASHVKIEISTEIIKRKSC
jgi:LacI family transcriptional regulator